jgi:hypothetical protein
MANKPGVDFLWLSVASAGGLVELFLEPTRVILAAKAQLERYPVRDVH